MNVKVPNGRGNFNRINRHRCSRPTNQLAQVPVLDAISVIRQVQVESNEYRKQRSCDMNPSVPNGCGNFTRTNSHRLSVRTAGARRRS